MANWSNPTLTSLYTDFVTEVKNRDVDLALGLDPATTSPTNVPTNAIRWNSASFKYQKWDGSTWNDLSAKYIFTSVEVSGSTVPVNGMYLSTTNTLNFSTASTASRLTIDGSGNVNIDSGTFYVDAVNNRVGVGTTGPTTSLQVGAGSGLQQAYISGGGYDLYLGASGGSAFGFASQAASLVFNNTAVPLAIGTLQSQPLILGTVGTERLRLDASGNLGLGVVPSAWSGLTAAQVANASIRGSSGVAGFGHNNYYDGTNFRYQLATFASDYYQINGTHVWRTAPSWNGTGSNAITFTQAMTLDASGRLLIGQTGTGLQAARSMAWQGSGEGTLYMSHSTSDGNGDSFINFGYNANLIGKLIQVGTTSIGLYSNDALTFGTVGSERARIDSSGYMQGTVNGLGAGRIPAKQYYRLDSARNGVNQAAAQSVFGVGVTLVGSTVYEFEALYWLQCSSASGSPTMNFLFGGTATLNNIMYSGVGPGSTSVLPPASFYDAAPTSFITNVATASTVSGTLTSAVSVVYLIKGTVSVNAGGTFIPQYSFDVAPGNLFTTNAGSYFSIWPLAASGAAVNIGSWA